MLSKNKSQPPRLNKFTVWLLSASSSKIGTGAGIYFGCFMFLVTAIIALTGKQPPKNVLLFIAIMFVSSILAGIFFGKTMAYYSARQKRARDEAVGVKLSPSEILELTLWFRHGVKPKSKKLQPVLGNYLNYLADLTSGKLIPRIRILRYLTLIIFGIQIPLDIYIIFFEHKNLSNHILNLIFASSFFIFYASLRPGKSNRVLRLLGTKQFKKIKRMRGDIDSKV